MDLTDNSRHCARLYKDGNDGYGIKIADINEGEENDLYHKNFRVSLVCIENGCTFDAYAYRNFKEFMYTITGDVIPWGVCKIVSFSRWHHGDQLISYRCYCKGKYTNSIYYMM